MQTIDPLQLEALVDRGEPLQLIDVRTPEEFEETHALGARNIPLCDLIPTFAIHDFPADQHVYVMSRNETLARLAAEELEMAGCQDPIIVEGGVEAWDRNGLPIVRGHRSIRFHSAWFFVALLICVGVMLGVTIHASILVVSVIIAILLFFWDLMQAERRQMLRARGLRGKH